MNPRGLVCDLASLSRLSGAETRSISPENETGEPGGGARCALEDGQGKHAARDLGKGWKVNPYVVLAPGETRVLADIGGPGAIQHIWLTLDGSWRFSILRIYWDGQAQPAVECPVGDFFCCGWGRFAQVSSLAVCVNPANSFNCYWPMPFHKHCRITLENLDEKDLTVFYQITYALGGLSPEEGYFHAQFRRSNPLAYKQPHVLLDGVRGQGQYVGTYIAWGVHNNRWWGEGEVKFYLDGDGEYPTICGTGTEDYFGGSYCFENPEKPGSYLTYTTPYAGFHQALLPDGHYASQTRFGMYRWHITDPIRFKRELRVDIQALGWRSGERYLPLQDDISSVAFWYQSLPAAPRHPLPEKDLLEVI